MLIRSPGARTSGQSAVKPEGSPWSFLTSCTVRVRAAHIIRSGSGGETKASEWRAKRGSIAAAVPGRIERVEAGRHAAQVVGEAAVRRVEVEVSQLHVAAVAKPVDDEGRRERERADRKDALLPLRPDQERQLAGEDVEEVAVGPVDVRRGAVAPGPDARPGRDQPRAVAQDLEAVLGAVTDHLALAGA